MVAFLPTSVAVEFSKERESERKKLDCSKWNAKVTSKFAAMGSGGSVRQHALWRAGPLRTHRHLHLEEKLSDWLDLQKARERERNKGGEPADLELRKEKQAFSEKNCVHQDQILPHD